MIRPRALIGPRALVAPLLLAAGASALSWSIDRASGAYSVSLEEGSDTAVVASAATTLCHDGVVYSTSNATLAVQTAADATGADSLGAWTGVSVTFAPAPATGAPGVGVRATFKAYAARPGVLALSTAFFGGVRSAGCGGDMTFKTFSLLATLPAFDAAALDAPRAAVLSWQDVGTTVFAQGLANYSCSGVHCGPLVLAFPAPAAATSAAFAGTVVVSSLDNHKIVSVDSGARSGAWAMGPVAQLPVLPDGFETSFVVVGDAGLGPTEAIYRWGRALQDAHGTTRLPAAPDSTRTALGVFTDNGGFYNVWPPKVARPYSAEVGLEQLMQSLRDRGIPARYLMLDDWWYTGPYYLNDVKCVAVWEANPDAAFFPSGLPALARDINVSMMLYTPFYCNLTINGTDFDFKSAFEMVSNSLYTGSKMVVPRDAHAFFGLQLDEGLAMTGGALKTMEWDFVGANTQHFAPLYADTDAANAWFAGLGGAAAERGIEVQLCLAYPADLLMALDLPAVTNARASGDYCFSSTDHLKDPNLAPLGGSALLFDAIGVAPSKDVFWSATPQPPTRCGYTPGYSNQSHVTLDVIMVCTLLPPSMLRKRADPIHPLTAPFAGDHEHGPSRLRRRRGLLERLAAAGHMHEQRHASAAGQTARLPRLLPDELLSPGAARRRARCALCARNGRGRPGLLCARVAACRGPRACLVGSLPGTGRRRRVRRPLLQRRGRLRRLRGRRATERLRGGRALPGGPAAARDGHGRGRLAALDAGTRAVVGLGPARRAR